MLLRAGLVRLLTDEGMEVDGGSGLLGAVLTHRPDLAIVDVRMPPTFTDEGLRAAVAARERVPGLPIHVLSRYVEESYAVDLVDGAEGIGYLLKERVAAGGTSIDPEVVTQLLVRRRRNPIDQLSPCQREVLELMAQGVTNGAIAGRLGVSGGAVEKHIGRRVRRAPRPPRPAHRRRGGAAGGRAGGLAASGFAPSAVAGRCRGRWPS